MALASLSGPNMRSAWWEKALLNSELLQVIDYFFFSWYLNAIFLWDLELLNNLLTETSGLLAAMRSDLDDAAMTAAERAERNAELRARMEGMKGEMQAQFSNVFSKMLGMIGKDPADLLSNNVFFSKIQNHFTKSNFTEVE